MGIALQIRDKLAQRECDFLDLELLDPLDDEEEGDFDE